jgi:hypothetical protein
LNILGEVVEEARGALALGAPGDVAAVVLDPRAGADLHHHLDVEVRPALQPLRLQQLPRAQQLLQPPVQLRADLLDGALDGALLGDEVRGGVDGRLLQRGDGVAGERVEAGDALDLVAPQLDADPLLLVGGEDLHGVAAHAEVAALEGGVVARVLHVHQRLEDLLPPDLLPHLQHHHKLPVLARVAQAVDAGDGGDDDHVVALHQRAGGAQPQLLDVLVDRRVLLDEGVAAGDVRLGLVVVVVADEVLDGVLREELLELAVELRGERLVVAHHQRGPPVLGDHVRHGEGLSRPRGAEQRLVRVAALQRLGELGDGARLVAGGLEG